MLLSPLESNRSQKNPIDISSQQDTKLVYQLESLTQKLAERERREKEMDTEIKQLQQELGAIKNQFELRNHIKQR